MFRAALRSALATKLKENQLNVVDAFTLTDHKTKPFAKALSGLGFSRKILVVDHQENPNLQLAARNISEVSLVPSLQITPYQVLNASHVVFSKAAIQAIEEVLKK
jgi:large subunit ribosomal protein L4